MAGHLTLPLLICCMVCLAIHQTNAQNSFDVQSDINIGLHVGVSIAICIFLVLGLTGIINLIKYKMLGKGNRLERVSH
jgi:high-affinity nickel permease